MRRPAFAGLMFAVIVLTGCAYSRSVPVPPAAEGMRWLPNVTPDKLAICAQAVEDDGFHWSSDGQEFINTQDPKGGQWVSVDCVIYLSYSPIPFRPGCRPTGK